MSVANLCWLREEKKTPRVGETRRSFFANRIREFSIRVCSVRLCEEISSSRSPHHHRRGALCRDMTRHLTHSHSLLNLTLLVSYDLQCAALEAKKKLNGKEVEKPKLGERAGVGWLASGSSSLSLTLSTLRWRDKEAELRFCSLCFILFAPSHSTYTRRPPISLTPPVPRAQKYSAHRGATAVVLVRAFRRNTQKRPTNFAE